jgi:enoyl-CoA hydratase/carnithine racemase
VVSYETILYDVHEGIATITLNRPQAMNARSVRMQVELLAAYTAVYQDPAVRVVILTGAGDRAFCAGRDLKEVAAVPSLVEDRRRRAEPRDTEVLGRLDKPTVAAINGYALGGGLEMALACDIRIAAEGAQLGLTEVRRGQIPGSGGTQRLPRLIGRGPAMELLLTGAMIDAEHAQRLGIVSRVVPRAELAATAEELARTIAARAPIAVRYVKEAVNKGLDLSLAQGLQLEADLSILLQTTEDYLEGARAFVEKREPDFQGR